MYYKNLFKIFSFLYIFSVFLKICNDLTADPANTRLMMHDMYKNENYTMAFLGASHTMQSFDPYIFDEKIMDCNAMNLGSASQTPEGTYFLFQDFLKNNDPNTVIMEITYGCYEDEVWDKDTPLPEYWLFDYMRPSVNKARYFFEVFDKEDYANALFPIYRNRNKLKLDQVIKNYSEKLRNGYYQYKGFENPNGGEYLYKGFAKIDWSYENRESEPMSPYEWNDELIIKEKIEYLKKITNLCKSNNLDIIWVTTPSPIYSIIEMGNYEKAHDYFQTLAEHWNVDYFDFNYYRIELLDRNDYIYFYDSSHMNTQYAEKFSESVCKVLEERNKGSLEYERYFYGSCDEMIKECYSANLYNYLN